jgi:hypothetical protein
MPAPIAVHDALPALLHPRAVIAATDATTKHGCIVLTNLRTPASWMGFTASAAELLDRHGPRPGRGGSALRLRRRGVADRRPVCGAGRSARHAEPADPS